jgi:hypothetical protein
MWNMEWKIAFTLHLLFGCGFQPLSCFPLWIVVTRAKVCAIDSCNQPCCGIAQTSAIEGEQVSAAYCANPAACEFESCCLNPDITLPGSSIQ